MVTKGVADLLHTPQFGGAPGAPLPVRRPPSASPAPAPARPALPRPETAPPAEQPPAAKLAPQELAALLGMLGLGQARPATPPPAPAVRQPVRSAKAEKLIATALKDPDSERKPLYLSGDGLDELDIDEADLGLSLAHLGLHAAPNWDGQGGILLARAPGILEAAERLRSEVKPVPIVPVTPARHDTG